MTASSGSGASIGAIIEGAKVKVRRVLAPGSPLPIWAHEEDGIIMVDFDAARRFLELRTDPITAVAEILKFLKREYPETSNYRIV